MSSPNDWDEQDDGDDYRMTSYEWYDSGQLR